MGEPDRYIRRVSGPLLDRLDLKVEMPRVRPVDLITGPPPESSAVVAGRVREARQRALARNRGVANALLPGAAVARACALSSRGEHLVADLATGAVLSARGVHRLMRVARTIADLGARASVAEEDVLAAASLRDPAHVQPLAA